MTKTTSLTTTKPTEVAKIEIGPNLDIFKPLERPKGILPRIDGQPISLRADCGAKGMFKIDAAPLKTLEVLSCTIIGLHKYYGKLGKTKANWIQLWLIPSPECNEPKIESKICTLYVKSYGLDNLINSIESVIFDIGIAGNIFELRLTPKSNEMGEFHILEFTNRKRINTEPEQLKDIVNFMAAKPKLVDEKLPETMTCLDGKSPEEVEELKKSTDEKIKYLEKIAEQQRNQLKQ